MKLKVLHEADKYEKYDEKELDKNLKKSMTFTIIDFIRLF